MWGVVRGERYRTDLASPVRVLGLSADEGGAETTGTLPPAVWRLPGPRGCRCPGVALSVPRLGAGTEHGGQLRPGESPLGEQRDSPWFLIQCPPHPPPHPMPLNH